MAVRVAINGFGRIGRLAFRQMFGAEGYEVVAINDLTSPKMLAHLLKYDSSQGKYEHADEVSSTDDSIIVCGKEIKIYAFPDANNCPWGDLKVDVVLECSGFYTSKEKAQAHINAGARKVVISAPAGNDLPTIVYNTNHETLKASDTIISAASCTTNCLAPMADALNKYAPIQSGIMVTIHAYTGDQMTLDGPQRKGDLRRSRAAAVNIVPNSTGAAKAIGLVIPELNGKLIGHILLTRMYVIQEDGNKFESLLVAPLSVLLEYRDHGVGSALMKEGLRRGRELGYKAAFLCGDPEYYHRFGFKSIREFGLTNPEIPEPYAMGYELVPGALDQVTGVVKLT